MTRQQLLILAAFSSALLLATAFGFQYIGDLPPCKMCIWQRWPHAIAVVIGLVGALIYHRGIAFLGALAALTSAIIGLYHSGIEQYWWQGPTTCTAQPLGDLTAAEALKKILAAPVVRCDEIPWELFGMSMASWNAVVSFVLVLIWLQAARS